MASEKGDIILVVVDDEFARRLTIGSLRDGGFQAFSVSDPSKALDAVRADPDSFALLLTETSASAMPGTELAQRARRWAPHLRMLFLVGDESPARAALWNHGTVLSKPFTPDELLLAVRRALTRP